MRRARNAKIVATLGPASSDRETVRALFIAGVDVFRLNFSHGSAADHRARFALLRELEKELGRPIAILADLQGPKLRVGAFANGPVMLVEGQTFRLDLDPAVGDSRRAACRTRRFSRHWYPAPSRCSTTAAFDSSGRLRLRNGGTCGLIPAHTTTMSTPPNTAAARSKTAATEAGSTTSQATGSACPPAAAMIPHVSASYVSVRAVQHTAAPARA